MQAKKIASDRERERERIKVIGQINGERASWLNTYEVSWMLGIKWPRKTF